MLYLYVKLKGVCPRNGSPATKKTVCLRTAIRFPCSSFTCGQQVRSMLQFRILCGNANTVHRSQDGIQEDAITTPIAVSNAATAVNSRHVLPNCEAGRMSRAIISTFLQMPGCGNRLCNCLAPYYVGDDKRQTKRKHHCCETIKKQKL